MRNFAKQEWAHKTCNSTQLFSKSHLEYRKVHDSCFLASKVHPTVVDLEVGNSKQEAIQVKAKGLA